MDEFTEFEHAAWEAKASKFSSTWGTVTAQIIPYLIHKCRIAKGIRVVDIGCGTGELVEALSRAGASVVAFDASLEMCRIARERVKESRILQSDAESLPCDDKEFDAVCMNYLLLHVADQAHVLREGARVLKPGGILCWTNWVHPTESPGMNIIFSALADLADFSVLPPAPDIFQFSDTTVSTTLLRPLGFREVEQMIVDTKWSISSGEAFFDAIQAGTRIGGLVERQSPSIKAALKDRISSAVEKLRKGNLCQVPMPTHLFTAFRECAER